MDKQGGQEYTLFGDPGSGNCYKVALTLSLTGTPWHWHSMDVLGGSTRTAEFLALNPNGKMPILQLPDGRILAESNAITLFLAENTTLLPADPYTRALVYQWMFFEQYSHEPYVAVARFLLHYPHGEPVDAARMVMLHERGNNALRIMNEVLSAQDFFAGDQYSVADIALFAYTHVAADGGFDLDRYPALQEWLRRVRTQPGHFDLADSPL